MRVERLTTRPPKRSMMYQFGLFLRVASHAMRATSVVRSRLLARPSFVPVQRTLQRTERILGATKRDSRCRKSLSGKK